MGDENIGKAIKRKIEEEELITEPSLSINATGEPTRSSPDSWNQNEVPEPHHSFSPRVSPAVASSESSLESSDWNQPLAQIGQLGVNKLSKQYLQSPTLAHSSPRLLKGVVIPVSSRSPQTRPRFPRPSASGICRAASVHMPRSSTLPSPQSSQLLSPNPRPRPCFPRPSTSGMSRAASSLRSSPFNYLPRSPSSSESSLSPSPQPPLQSNRRGHRRQLAQRSATSRGRTASLQRTSLYVHSRWSQSSRESSLSRSPRPHLPSHRRGRRRQTAECRTRALSSLPSSLLAYSPRSAISKESTKPMSSQLPTNHSRRQPAKCSATSRARALLSQRSSPMAHSTRSISFRESTKSRSLQSEPQPQAPQRSAAFMARAAHLAERRRQQQAEESSQHSPAFRGRVARLAERRERLADEGFDRMLETTRPYKYMLYHPVVVSSDSEAEDGTRRRVKQENTETNNESRATSIHKAATVESNRQNEQVVEVRDARSHSTENRPAPRLEEEINTPEPQEAHRSHLATLPGLGSTWENQQRALRLVNMPAERVALQQFGPIRPGQWPAREPIQYGQMLYRNPTWQQFVVQQPEPFQPRRRLGPFRPGSLQRHLQRQQNQMQRGHWKSQPTDPSDPKPKDP